MAYHGRIPEERNHREGINQASMARVQSASLRLQSILGLGNNTNPYDPPPHPIGRARITNERVSSLHTARLGSPISEETMKFSRNGEKGGHALDEKDRDDTANHARTTSPRQIGVATTTAGPVAAYLSPPSSSTTRVPIERELYDRLKSYSQAGPATRIDLISLSIHDLTPERHTGLHQNKLLLHVEAGEGRSLAVCEAVIPESARTSDGKSGKWIYFIVEPEGAAWTVFACPINAVDKPSEGKEAVVKDGGEQLSFYPPKPRYLNPFTTSMPPSLSTKNTSLTKTPHLLVWREYTRVELDMCRDGIPLFDGFDIPTSPWLDVVKAMGRGKCRVRYLHELEKAASKSGKRSK